MHKANGNPISATTSDYGPFGESGRSFFAHLAAAAFFAIARRSSADRAAARARPPFDAPSLDSVTAATLRRSFLDMHIGTECLPEQGELIRTHMVSV